ncbi:prepilin peptidase [Actinospica durhamensis]|uniref:Prepilin peptidase n=1 Tax=Actinospica durhamensis TaxID=1508375 RepID=A0A941IQ78_9ACTN|nr:A24 family peptidase [Actinospica durhamensis]MBR7833922.1 prepilin peptidase [Actinospica durhamensis]
MQWVVGVVYAGFLLGSAVLAAVDARTNRLPDKVMFPLYAWGLLGLAAASWAGEEWWRLLLALGVAAVFYGFFWAQWFFGLMGFGDVKLAGLLGLFLGWASLPLAMAGLLCGMVVAMLVSLGRIALGRAKRKSQVAFGAYLILGAWAASAAQAVHLLRG